MGDVIRLAILFCCAFANLATASAEKRVALVIGNAKYEHIAGLPNVHNDAKAMEALLKAAKFDSVVVLQDKRVAELRRELLEFAERAADADVAVVFYAGHGIEVDRVNYLIPIDARLKNDLAVEDETVSLDRVLKLMEPVRKLRVVILDACRDNPFVKSMRLTAATRSVTRGLGRIEAGGANTLIAFATEPNAVAEDGSGANSPFTAALVKHLATPGLDLRIALGNVRDEVMASTTKKQRPYVTSSLGGGIISLAAVDAKSGVLLPTGGAGETARICREVEGMSNPVTLAVLERLHKGTPAGECVAARLTQLAMVSQPAPPKVVELAVGAFNPSRGATSLSVAEERALKPKDSFKECVECPEMAVVPAGTFTMGSPSGEPRRSDHEGPQQVVTIARPFAVGRFEVTFAEWDACVAAGGCKHSPGDRGWGRSRRPVIDVSWHDITDEYLPWLSRKTGKSYRLLTEAEWEYMARAGTTSPFWWGSTFEAGPLVRGSKATAPVDSYSSNPWGLFHVHGNVSEWVDDCWNSNHGGAPIDGSARRSGDCNRRVLRGGSWDDWSGIGLRAAARESQVKIFRSRALGFRVARALAQ